MPMSVAARTVRRTASTPRRWPSTRGSPRAAAQRPLPSMMMATCRGTAIADATGILASVIGMCPSDCEDLLFLPRQPMIDFRDAGIRRFLNFGGIAVVIVLADLMILFHLLDRFHRIAAHVPHGDASRFRVFVRDLHQFFAAFFVQLRHT